MNESSVKNFNVKIHACRDGAVKSKGMKTKEDKLSTERRWKRETRRVPYICSMHLMVTVCVGRCVDVCVGMYVSGCLLESPLHIVHNYRRSGNFRC